MPLPFAFAGLRSVRCRQTRFFVRLRDGLRRVRSWFADRLFGLRGNGDPPATETRAWHLEVGRRGEIAAADHLASLGYRVLFRNVRIAGGELDIVALHDRTVVFVEVKSRLGGPVAAWERVDGKKRRLLLHAAEAFMRRKRLRNLSHRFDVVTVCWPTHDSAGKPIVRVYRNAFTSARGNNASPRREGD